MDVLFFVQFSAEPLGLSNGAQVSRPLIVAEALTSDALQVLRFF